MMRTEAGLVGGVLTGLRIVHRHPAVGAVERELDRRRVTRALLAEVWIIRLVAGRGEPDAALPVEHRVVVVRPRVPDVLLGPIGRGSEELDRSGIAGPERQRHI